MSFATAKEEKISNKIVLVEIDLGRRQLNWLNYCAGIWSYRFNTFKSNQEHSFGHGNFLFGSFESSGTFDSGISFTPFDVGSCFVDGEEYINEVASRSACVSTNKSWFYDRGETEFCIHIDKGEDPRLHQIILGITLGLSNKAKNINNGIYQPLLTGNPQINKTKDPLEFGIIRFDTGSLSFKNQDGFFDNLTDNIIYGQPVAVKYGIDDIDGTEMAYADYKKIAKSYIERVAIDFKQCNVTLADYRKRLSRKIPFNTFDKTTYPDLKDKNVGKTIPFPFGTLYNIPCICCNEEQSPTPSNYSFAISDLLQYPGGVQWIAQAYVDGVKTTKSFIRPIGGSTFTDVAVFAISSANYTPGQKVTVDILGIGTRNLVMYSHCEFSSYAPRLLQWGESAPANCTWARDSAKAYEGTYSYKITKTIAAGTGAYALVNDETENDLLNSMEGEQVTFSAWVYVPSTGGPSALNEIMLRISDNDGGGFTYTDSGNPSAFDTWERLTVTRTIRTGLTTLRFQCRIESAAANGEFYYVDNIQIERAASATDWIKRELWNNSLEIIEHILDTYDSTPYNSTFYNTTEWDAAKSETFDLGIFLNKPTKISQIISVIASSNFGNFIVHDDGTYTFRILDKTVAADETILLDEYFESPKIDYDGSKFLAYVRIGYAKDHAENEYRWYEKNDLADDIEWEYKQRPSKEYETYLTNETDAQALAERFMDLMQKVRGIITTKTGIQNVELEISDIKNLTLDRISRGWKGPLKTEIISLQKDLLGTGKVTIKGIVIED